MILRRREGGGAVSPRGHRTQLQKHSQRPERVWPGGAPRKLPKGCVAPTAQEGQRRTWYWPAATQLTPGIHNHIAGRIPGTPSGIKLQVPHWVSSIKMRRPPGDRRILMLYTQPRAHTRPYATLRRALCVAAQHRREERIPNPRPLLVIRQSRIVEWPWGLLRDLPP